MMSPEGLLTFFIGIQNLCLDNNRVITSLQWGVGNLFVALSVGFALLLIYSKEKFKRARIYNKSLIAYICFCALYLIIYNWLSFSLPIDEKEAVDKVLTKNPQIAQTVLNEIAKLKTIRPR